MNCKQGIGKQTKNGTEYGIWSGVKIGICDFEDDQLDFFNKLGYEDFMHQVKENGLEKHLISQS